MALWLYGFGYEAAQISQKPLPLGLIWHQGHSMSGLDPSKPSPKTNPSRTAGKVPEAKLEKAELQLQ